MMRSTSCDQDARSAMIKFTSADTSEAGPAVPHGADALAFCLVSDDFVRPRGARAAA
jgi:hypothetical protein